MTAPWFSTEFCSWAADRLLDQLRAGDLPECTPAYFAWDPLLPLVRSAVAETDLSLARKLVANSDSLMWGAILSRGFLDDRELTAALVVAFASEMVSERKIGLLHHLSARPLSDEHYDCVFAWLRDDPSEFIEEQREKFSDSLGNEHLRERLTSDDAGFVNKRWLYMYSVHALDPAEARRVLETERNNADARVVAAAEHSLSLLG